MMLSDAAEQLGRRASQYQVVHEGVAALLTRWNQASEDAASHWQSTRATRFLDDWNTYVRGLVDLMRLCSDASWTLHTLASVAHATESELRVLERRQAAYEAQMATPVAFPTATTTTTFTAGTDPATDVHALVRTEAAIDGCLDEWNAACRRCGETLDGIGGRIEELGATTLSLDAFAPHLRAAIDARAATRNLDDPRSTYTTSGMFWWKGKHDEYERTSSFGHRSLFRYVGSTRTIAATDVNQGDVGDCYLAAALASLAASAEGKELIASMIIDNGNGTYTVKFGDEIVTVDDDLYVASGADPAYADVEYELVTGTKTVTVETTWFAFVEKAYAELNGGGYQKIVGGRAENVFKELGLGGAHYKPGDLGQHELAERLLTDFDAGRAMTASADLDQFGGDGKHAFSITRVWERSDGTVMVTVRNPWGHNEPLPALPGGLKRNGRITMTSDELGDHFSRVDTQGAP
ncbi:MAG: C2 family cysteine protease [Actinomycetota bacterium]